MAQLFSLGGLHVMIFQSHILAEGVPMEGFGAFLVLLICALPFIALFTFYFCFYSWLDNQNRQDLQDRAIEEVRCLKCGAAIDSKEQSCQKCGWTWK